MRKKKKKPEISFVFQLCMKLYKFSGLIITQIVWRFTQKTSDLYLFVFSIVAM